MYAICVDDEPILLDWLAKTVSNSPDIEGAQKFTNELAALEYAKNHSFDVAFLDIELHAMNGIDVAEKLREINPNCGIVFCTGHANYAIDAISKVLVDGYLLKPIEYDDVQKEIDRIKQTHQSNALVTIDLTKGINIIDMNGQAIHFKRSKTEHLLETLVLKDGDSLSVENLCNILWEDSKGNPYLLEKNANYLTQLLTDLRRALEEHGALDVLKKTSSGYSIRMPFVKLIK